MAILISSSSGQIGKVDPLTGTFTSVGSGASFTDIASSSDGKLFGVTFDQLYSIDPNSGSSSLIGSLRTGVQINALGFSANNVLYAAGGSNLYTIDPNTGTASLVANLGSDFFSSGDLVFDPVNNRFLATSTGIGGDSLFSVNLNGTATKIGDIGFSNVYGLSFENGTLFGYTADRREITINSTTGQGNLNRNVTGISGEIFGSTNFETPLISPTSPYEYETVTGGSTKLPETPIGDILPNLPTLLPIILPGTSLNEIANLQIDVLEALLAGGILPDVDPNQRKVRFNLVKDLTNPTDPLGQTWVIIHGWRDNPESPGMKSLADAVAKAATPNDRVLTLDWKEASNIGNQLSDGNFIAATWIRPVAELAVKKLQALGINGTAASNSLNLIGHSLGSLVSSEIAAIYQEQSGVKVKTVTALDPPSVTNENLPVRLADLVIPGLLNDYKLYDLDGRKDGTQEPENFRDVAESSRAFVGRRSIAGNQELAGTAHESFQMDFGDEFRSSPAQEHGWVVDTFSNLINQTPEKAGFLNKTFSLNFDNRIYDNFKKDAYFAYYDSPLTPANKHEGIIEVNEPNQPIIFVAKNADPLLGEDADIVFGTTGDDRLDGFNLIISGPTRLAVGGSELFSGAGNDQIFGDQGNDEIYGDSGNDTINGNQGNDTIYGNQGKDFIRGGKDNDLISGGKEEDIIYGDKGEDTLNGDNDNDSLYGGEDKDQIFGGAGNDILYGNQGNDTLYGNQDADIIYGGQNDDVIYGGRDNDTLLGDEGNDFLSGDLGDDVLYGRQGKDTLTGGFGSDTFVFAPGDGAFFVGPPTEDTLKNIADIITDFHFGVLSGSDKIGLTGGLTFGSLDFVEFTNGLFNLGRSTAIKIRDTGEYLALLEGISKDSIGVRENFIENFAITGT